MHIVGCIYSSISNLYIHSSICILYMYVCMLICIYEYVCVYIYISLFLSLFFIYIYVCMCVCMHLCMYVCMYACMYIYILTYIYTGRPEVGAYPAVLAQLLAAASRADSLAGARWGGLDVTATR
jgi:hypothetical protein